MTERVYYNRAKLVKIKTPEPRGDFKTCDFMFAANTKDGELVRTYRLWLTEENNDRNRELLQILGAKNPPKIVNSETIAAEIPGLGDRLVDLVAETNEKGFENIKYVNEPKFAVKVR